MAFTSDYPTMWLNDTVHSIMVVDSSQDTGSGIVWCPVRNNTDPGDDSHRHFLDTAQFVTGLLIYPTFCFPGLVGNMLTVIVLSRRNMLTSTNAFLSALAVSDSIKLINDILYFFVILFLRTNPPLGNQAYGYLYPYAHFVFNMSVCVSSWLTVSVAVERYILVCLPTRARSVWSRRRAVMLCTLVYFVMTSLALPSFFRYRTIHCMDSVTNQSRLDVELTELWKSNSFVIAYTWAQNLLRSIIPLLILVVLNTCIIHALSHTKARRRRNSRHRVTIMMIVVILAFLICITPDAILSTVFGFGYYEASNLARAIREITDTLLTINAAINFLIYCAFNQVFRKSFAQLCKSPKRGSITSGMGWVTEMDESTYRRLSEAQTPIASNNNCSPHLDTPTYSYSDQSPAFFPSSPTSLTASSKLPEQSRLSDEKYCDHGGDATKVYDVNHQEHEQPQKFVPNGVCPHRDDSANSINQEESIRQRLMLQHQHRLEQRRYAHDPRRGSSHGLKKSKNSLKRGRNARSSSIKQKQLRRPEIVTYIPSEDNSPMNPFSRNAASSSYATSSTNTHAHEVNDVRPESSPLTTPLPSDQTETDKNSNNNMPIDIQQSILKTDDPYQLLVFKEPSEVSAANENISRNNESSSLFNDNGQDDKMVEAKHRNVNMINNDLTYGSLSLVPKNGPLKESNLRRPDKGVGEKKKSVLTVSFSDDSSF